MTRVPLMDPTEPQPMTARDFLLNIGFKNDEIDVASSNVDEVIVSPTEITFSMYTKTSNVTFRLLTSENGEITGIESIETNSTPFTIQLMENNKVNTFTLKERFFKSRNVLFSDNFRTSDTFYFLHISKLFKEIIETY